MNEKLKQEYHERNIRWSQTAINQLSFFNNLLLSLGVGFLAFCFNPILFKTLNFTLKEIDFSKTFLAISIISILVSIILGLVISISRLKDFRITRTINHIRQRTYEHSEKVLDERTPDKYDRIKRICTIFKKPPKITSEECKDYYKISNFDSRFRELRNISHNLGINSWNYINYQTFFFGLSLILYLFSIFN